MRLSLGRRLAAGAACVLLAGVALVATATFAHAAAPSAVFAKDSDWGSGWQGKFTVNGGDTGLSSWKIDVDMPAGSTIGSVWDAQKAQSGSHYTFTNFSWNGSVPANGSLSFGFLGTGSGSPTNCTINGTACGGGGTTPTAPGTPGTPSVTSVTSSSISLSWGAASGTVTGYRVYEGTSVKADVATTSATISGLTASSSHTYSVAAYNTAGESAKSATVTAATTGGPGVPGAVSGLSTGAVTDTSIALTWTSPGGTITGYRVYEGSSVKADVTTASATISSLAKCSAHTFAVAAYNGVGEGPRTATATGTTTGCTGGGALPKHFLTGYWHNFDNPARELRLRDVPAAYDVVAVAFAEASGTPGAVTFGVDAGLSASLGGYTNADFKSDVATLHSRGQKVILSVGGQNGAVGVNSGASAANFASSVTGIIRDFGFDGVDIDLENGVSATFMGDALRSIRNSVGANLIITMAPQTIDMQSAQMEYFKLALNIKDILTVVHMQYYNSGSMLGCDKNQAYSQGTINFLTALACIQLENGLRPDQVALGLPSGAGAAGGGIIAPSVVNDALNCLARGTNCGSFKPPQTYPGIRGAMTWSINWDVTNGGGFGNTVGPFLDTLP